MGTHHRRQLHRSLKVRSSHRPTSTHRVVQRTHSTSHAFTWTTRRTQSLAARRTPLFGRPVAVRRNQHSQILTDAELPSILSHPLFKHSNIVTLGGPNINSFTRNIFDSWPTKSPIFFPSPDTSAQFAIQDRTFYENGTALLTLAPHPTDAEALTLVAHGMGLEGISRAARLLPTRTATMIPEWVVVDRTAEWMGEGGVLAAGWYGSNWGWSEAGSYVQ